MVGCRAALVVALFAPATAAAQPADAPPEAPPAGDGATDHRVNLRVGGSTGDANGRPSVCAEVAITWGLSVEGCGTGSGILHSDDGGEMAHFRVNKTVWTATVGRGQFRAAGGLGFAELEVGEDRPGFDFGTPDGDRTSVAGAEVAVSARYLAPLGRGFEFIANGSLGLAWFDGARDLVEPQSRAQPFASVEVGVGW